MTVEAQQGNEVTDEEVADLLGVDDEDTTGGDDDSDGDDSGAGEDDDNDSGDTGLTIADVEAVIAANSVSPAELDRRIGQFSRTISKKLDALVPGKQTGSEADSQDEAVKVTAEGRGEFREHLGDKLKKTSAEWDLAVQVGLSNLNDRVQAGEDELTAAKVVAAETSAKISEFVESIEKRTVERLRRNGKLVDAPGKPAKGPVTTGHKARLLAGAEKARQMGIASETKEQ